MTGLDVTRSSERLLGWIDEPHPTRGVRFLRDDLTWQEFGYEELAQQVLRAAMALQQSGVRRDDVVPMVVPAGPDFLTTFFGLLVIGATPSVLPLPWALQGGVGYEAQLKSIATRIRPRFAVASSGYQDVLRRTVGELGQDVVILEPAYADGFQELRRESGELAVLQFTSGSRGAPRGLRVTVENMAANLGMIEKWLQLDEYGGVSWLPLYHDMGLVGGLLAAVTVQVQHSVMRPEHFIRDTSGWLAEYGRAPYAHMFMPNFGFERTVAKVRPEDLEGLDFSTLTSVISGAERVNPEVLASFVRLLEPHGFQAGSLMPAYGLAEGTLAVTGVPKGRRPRLLRTGSLDKRLGEKVDILETAEVGIEEVPDSWTWQVSCGRPLDGLAVEVADDEGRPQPEGVLGEILVKGPSVALGYADETAGDGWGAGEWLHTGDAGFQLDGDLYVVGRLGDSVKVNGRSVFVEDVELELSARTGIPQRRLTVCAGVSEGRPTLLVVSEQDLGGLLDAVEETVAAFGGAAVRLLVLKAGRGTIPLTSSGKPRRRTLWTRHLTGELEGEWLTGAAR
ncbi:AMP-binding protein [Streptomyces sp. NPDC001770]